MLTRVLGGLAFAGLLTALTTSPAAATMTPQDFRSEVVSRTNAERAKAGCPALNRHSALDNAAQGHAADMANRNYFSHNSLDGRTPWDRIRQAGYPTNTGRAENIAAGQTTPAAVVSSWMNSAGHRANMLNCSYRSIGVGYGYNSSSTYDHYWVQNFGTV
ncbi:CAP domain-containing protein [Kribbella sp. NPDC056345]|uniref:CAP domain-containing protein n=1 Tax=Kribbella sp. NPDC056345 TaxID=3345789 RepID=UPI0035D8EA46